MSQSLTALAKQPPSQLDLFGAPSEEPNKPAKPKPKQKASPKPQAKAKSIPKAPSPAPKSPQPTSNANQPARLPDGKQAEGAKTLLPPQQPQSTDSPPSPETPKTTIPLAPIADIPPPTNDPFLEQVVEALKARYADDIGSIALVLPSQRAGIYLKKHLSACYGKPIWSPEILSIPEFVAALTGLQIIDPVSLSFEFYHVYSSLESTAAGPSQNDFGQFVKWAPTLLTDFSEIDQYLTDTGKLFSHVNEQRAMDEWNPQGNDLTQFQQKYLDFWDALEPLYEGLRSHLLQQGMAYEGLAARLAAEQLQKQAAGPDNIQLPGQWRKVIFVGLNALTRAEQVMYETLAAAGLAEAFWDADKYYLDHPAQEAGHFLRKFRNLVPDQPFSWAFDNLSTDAKTIHLLGVSGNVSQAKAAGDLLTRFSGDDNFEDTALVLANEDLLVPVLQSLPHGVKHVNVTMGYPLRNAPLQGLWAAVFMLHENAARYARPGREKRFYYRDILKVLNHPIVRRIPDGFKLAGRMAYRIREGNKVFLSREILLELVAVEELDTAFAPMLPIFGDWENQPDRALEGMLLLIGDLKDAIMEARKGNNSGSVELEYLFMYTKVINRIRELSQRYGMVRDLATLRTLFNQVVGSHKVSFYGEPLRGLQVMGVLETRTLDFKNLVVLSANEDTLPTGKSENSFLPFDIRSAFGLPTHRERDALFAYHFYRLLQRAENVFLLYNTNAETLGGGEKSRFLTQLAHELPKINPRAVVKEQVLTIPVTTEKSIDTQIAKSQPVLELIHAFMERGVSPSALNTFVRCPLDFYYSYLLRLPETEEVEETIESATLGTIVHEILEAYYKPECGKPLQVATVRGWLETVEADTIARFGERFEAHEISYGKNLLIVKVAIRFLRNYLEKEIEALQQLAAEGQTLTVLHTELSLDHELDMVLPQREDQTATVLLKGHADRVDLIGDTIRIIDYKTGKVMPGELLIDDVEDLATEERNRKALQLLIYALLYFKKQDQQAVLKLESGIISFRNLSAGFMHTGIKSKSPLLDAELMQSVENQLKAMIANIYDQHTAFAHSEDSEYCLYCEV